MKELNLKGKVISSVEDLRNCINKKIVKITNNGSTNKIQNDFEELGKLYMIQYIIGNIYIMYLLKDGQSTEMAINVNAKNSPVVFMGYDGDDYMKII